MLTVSVPIAHELLAQCVRQGQALVQRASLVGDFSDYESWKAARNQWIEPTAQALAHMYDESSQAGEFTQTVKASGDGQRWQQQYVADLDAVKAAVGLLTTLQGELAFAGDDLEASPDLLELTPETAPAELTPETAAVEPLAETVPAEQRLEHPPGDPQGQEQPVERPGAERKAQEPVERPDAELGAQERHAEPARHEQRTAQAPPWRDADEPPEPADLRDRDERLDGPVVGAELAQAPFAGADLAHPADRSVSAERAGSPGPAPRTGKQVLVAHGPNERWMQAVTRLLERAGTHEVTILNERSKGRGALTEQFGEHAQGSRYAIVLLTADDIAAPRVESEDEPYFSPRAHQAVVFEMGFLVAALAPGCVCVLYEEGVQPPCDLDGIAYVRLDLAGTWQPKLLLQLRKAGFDYDLNKLVAA
jgi:predicted nucleotide-binding protein